MAHRNKMLWGLAAVAAAGALTAMIACGGGASAPSAVATTGLAKPIQDLMASRQLNEADVSAALKTYMPPGRKDEYYLFASGGQGGNMIVIGVPSMRILKYIGVFTPEPWQGYGYGDQSGKVLDGGNRHSHDLSWGDMHHPNFSETKGDYDGQFIFTGDKANARVAVVDLKDFVCKQIVASNVIESDHGASFVTPDTDYVIETSQYPAPLGGKYEPIEKFKDAYRGAMVLWKFDRAKGRIDPAQSFAIELPPYVQDLADSGKLASDGWCFVNSINTELAYGDVMAGNPPMESSWSQNDMDYLHVINWRQAAEVAKQAGKTVDVNGFKVIPLKTAVDEKLLFLVPEPKSPHGCDVTPDGQDIIVGGKLDTHTTVFNWAKMKALIDAGKFDGADTYGVPILNFQDSIRGQCEIGLGPLHTVFDGKGYAYTSVFIETVVAKWSLKDLKTVQKLPCSYNIGHLTAAEGDTVSPDGNYLVAMDKWSLDRFLKVGPLLPQNFQLVDIAGAEMVGLYDMPLPLGEPHYAQMIKADKLAPIEIYAPAGTDPYTDAKAEFAVDGGKERIERKGSTVDVYMTVVRSHFTPDIIRVKKGDTVNIHATSIEQAFDAIHGLAIGSYNINTSIEPGKHVDVSFKADQSGVFPMYCTEFCSALHLEMAGYLLVEP